MPKIVDHAARRIEIGEALRRVIVRAGVEGASVRVVAEEAGWSVGAVRHYFATQDELLRFGVEMQMQRIPVRVQAIHAGQPASQDRAGAVLEQLLPLDPERIAECRVWLAALGRARVDPSLDELRQIGLSGERALCRAAVCDLLNRPWPASLDEALGPDAEREVDHLHAIVSGLTLVATTHPDAMAADRVRAVLRRAIDDVHDRLESGHTGRSRR